MKLHNFVPTLASNIYRNSDNLSWGQAMKMAWDELKSNRDWEYVKFEKVSKSGKGEVTARIVSSAWTNYVTPKGTGRPLKPGLKIAADLGKVLAGKYPVITFYEDRVIDRIRFAS